MASYATLCTRFYDLDKPSAPEVGVRYYLSWLERAGGPALELMCGSGRYMEPFLSAGYDVDGVDSSPEMLDACRQRISSKWPNATLYEQSLEALELPRRYRLAIVPAGSFSLITDQKSVKDSLTAIFAVLEPGGSFVCEIQGSTVEPPPVEAHSSRSVNTGNPGEKITLETVSRLNPETLIETDHSIYNLIRDGKVLATEHEELALRYYQTGEFEALLSGTGFIDIGFDDTYPNTSPEDMGGTLIYHAARPI